jgi:hypothetical protein
MRQQIDIKSYLLHIFALNGFAVAQPVMSLLGDNPDFFVARGSQYTDLIVLTAILIFGLTLLLAVVYKILSKISKGSLQLVHHFMLAFLVGLVFLPVLKKFDLADGLLIPITSGIGIVFAFAYYKLRGLRLFVSALSPISLVFAGVFLFGPVANELRQPAEQTPQSGSGLTTSKTPVVMLIFDEFALTALMDAERNIDKSLFPNFHKLSENGSWYRNATTVATGTMISVPAMLTGNYPKEFVSQSFLNYSDTLFTVLADSHRMNVYESTTTMCNPELCSSSLKLTRSVSSRVKFLMADVSAIYLHIIANESLSARLPVINMTWENYWQLEEAAVWERHNYGGRLEQLEFFVNSISKSDPPGLNLIHTNFPHIPYQYLPSGKRYQGEWKIPGLEFATNQWGPNAWLVTQAYQRFLLQVASADLLIGNMIDHLESIGIYDESLIVVVADHGVSFYPDSHRRGVPPMINLDRDILPVPLFIKYPHQLEGEISDDNVETIDILPTIVDVLGAETEREMDGRSLRGEKPLRTQKLAYYAYKDFLQYKTNAGGEEKYRTLDWKLQNFQTSTGEDGVFQIGEYSGLIGSNINKLQVNETGDMEITLDKPGLYADVDQDSGFMPSQVTGSIESALPGLKPELAVVINGSIRAVTEMYAAEENTYRFSAMVPESSFKNGKNDVSVFQISTDLNGDIELLAGTQQPDQVSDGADSSSWVLSDNKLFRNEKEIPINTEKLEGWLEYARKDGGTIEFFGWALDVGAKDIIDKILIFEDGRHVYSGTTGMPRGEGVRYDASDALLVGFQFVIPENLFNAPGKSNIRFFAISRHGYAAELKYFDDYTWINKSQ